VRAGRGIAVLASVGAVVLAGCGTSNRDQVRAKVEQLVQAIAGHQYRTLCQQVLAPELTARLTVDGLHCEQAMQISLGGIHNAVLSIGRITVTGNKAQALTLTSASGQQGAFAMIELVKTGAGWRISSLAAPAITRRP
jgi:hypothetical protein